MIAEPVSIQAAPQPGSAYGPVQGYVAGNSAVGTKTDTPIENVPAAVQVVPRAVIEDQQALRIDEVLRNVPGTFVTESGEGATITSRGLGATVYVDGFLRSEFTAGEIGSSADLDTYNIERVDVLKGPSSVLFGRGNPGGAINLITKRPLGQPRYVSGITFGSDELIRPYVDLSGPLNADGSLAYRLNAVSENAESFRDVIESDRLLAAPTIAWAPTRNTTITVFGDFADINDMPDIGVPREPGSGRIFKGVPISRFLGEPTDFDDLEKREGRAIIEHSFSPDWGLRTGLQYSDVQSETDFTRASGVAADRRTVNRSVVRTGSGFEDAFMQTDLTGKVWTGPLAHKLLFGIELGNRKTNVLFSQAGASPIDLFKPVYGRDQPLGPFFIFTQAADRDTLSLYAQDQMSLFDERLIFVAGTRFDRVEQEGREASGMSNIGLTSSLVPNKEDEANSPRAGVVVKPLRGVSLYAQYAESFAPVNGFPLAFDGTVLEPETAVLREAGVKTEFFGGRLQSTLAFYDIERENLGVADPINPGFQIPVGKQESRGVDFDVSGEIVPGWRLIAAYAYIDVAILDDGPLGLNDGNRPINVPEHSGSIFSVYQFQDGPMKGFGFGGGLFYVGDRFGDLANTFFLEDYIRADATLFYETDRYTARLNVTNLFDEEIILNSARANFLKVDAPRSYLATLQYKF